jgi:hypothetical protein
MKTLLWFGILTIFAGSAQAAHFYSPILCSLEETYLKVQNKSSEPQSFWFQALGSSPFTESQVEVKAHGNLSLALLDYYHNNETAIAIKTQNNSLTFKAFCSANQLTWNIETAPSPWKKLSLPPKNSRLRFYFANLSQQTNSLEITYESPWRHLGSHAVVLSEAFAATSMDLELPLGTTSVKVHGQGRWTGKALTPKDQELFFKEETMVLKDTPPTRYFLFESRDHESPGPRDNFILPLENPKLIAESLEQIAHPDQARLLVARIEKSRSGLNRDFSSVVKSPWSWQVVEAQNYADFAHISCDGSPALVEERLNSWLIETGGTICFWSYRVVRELTPQEITLSHSLSHPALGSLPHKH